MTVFKQYQSVFANWDKEIFKSIHHDDFLFIRETELLTLEELTETTCKYMINEDQEKEGHPNVPGSFFCGRDSVPK